MKQILFKTEYMIGSFKSTLNGHYTILHYCVASRHEKIFQLLVDELFFLKESEIITQSELQSLVDK